jgi:hypothetical protein
MEMSSVMMETLSKVTDVASLAKLKRALTVTRGSAPQSVEMA